MKACCKPGSHSQQTTLLDLMDALPSSGPVAQKTEPWSTGTPANQTNPWGGTVAPANISDPWPSFGTKPAASVDPWGVPTTASIQSVPKNSDPWAASQQPASDAGKTADAWGLPSLVLPQGPLSSSVISTVQLKTIFLNSTTFELQKNQLSQGPQYHPRTAEPRALTSLSLNP